MSAYLAVLAFGPLGVAVIAALFAWSRVRAFDRRYGTQPKR